MHEVPSLTEEYATAVDTPFQTSPRLKTAAAQFVCRPSLYCNDSKDDNDVDLVQPVLYSNEVKVMRYCT